MHVALDDPLAAIVSVVEPVEAEGSVGLRRGFLVPCFARPLSLGVFVAGDGGNGSFPPSLGFEVAVLVFVVPLLGLPPTRVRDFWLLAGWRTAW